MRVTICEGCRLADPPPDAPTDGRALAGWLQERLTARGLAHRVQVEGAACLDVCGEGVTVAIEHGERRALLSYPADLDSLLVQVEGVGVGDLSEGEEPSRP